MEFIFKTESFNIFNFKSAEEQLVEPLKKITELNSRKKVAALWKIADGLNRRKKHVSKEVINRRIKRYRIWGFLIVLMSLFLFIPSITSPKELLVPLIVSSITTVIGLFFVFSCSGSYDKRLKKSAHLLVKSLENVKNYDIAFKDDGIDLNKADFIKYSDIKLLTKTQDFYVIFYRENVTVFSINTLNNVSNDLFEEFLFDKTGLSFEYCQL